MQYKINSHNLSYLCQRLGYSFQNVALLIQALSHRSFQSAVHNERLEFLGDTVLSLVISTALFKYYPTASEGILSQFRANLVCENTLAQLAQEFDLGPYLLLGAGELKMGGMQRPALLADALEAIIGAIYIDGSLAACEQRILAWYGKRLTQLSAQAHPKDPKTRLQEYLQAQKRPLPLYRLIDQTGASHAPVFQIACYLTDTTTHSMDSATGTGTSLRRAEQAAAAALLKKLITATH